MGGGIDVEMDGQGRGLGGRMMGEAWAPLGGDGRDSGLYCEETGWAMCHNGAGTGDEHA